jgi:hypothetical protein
VNNVELRIERLMLDGIPLTGLGPRSLQAAVESELAILLGKGGVANRLIGGTTVPGIRVAPIHLYVDIRPTTLGRQIAGAVYKGIGR